MSKDNQFPWQNRFIMKHARDSRNRDRKVKITNNKEKEVKTNESEKEMTYRMLFLSKWCYLISENKKNSNNHSVSKSSTSLHNLCGTLQSLNRMTFKNVTNRTVLVPDRVNAWAAAKEPHRHLQLFREHLSIHAKPVVVLCYFTLSEKKKKKQWINQEMNFGNNCSHPDNISLWRVFCSVWTAVQFQSISLSYSQWYLYLVVCVCVTPFSPV